MADVHSSMGLEASIQQLQVVRSTGAVLSTDAGELPATPRRFSVGTTYSRQRRAVAARRRRLRRVSGAAMSNAHRARPTMTGRPWLAVRGRELPDFLRPGRWTWALAYIWSRATNINQNDGSTPAIGLIKGSYDANVFILAARCPIPSGRSTLGMAAPRSTVARPLTDAATTISDAQRRIFFQCPPCPTPFSFARRPCSAQASWARRSPRISPMPTCPSLLFDLPAKEGDPNAHRAQGDRQPAKLEPAPLAARIARPRSSAANYDSTCRSSPTATW